MRYKLWFAVTIAVVFTGFSWAIPNPMLLDCTQDGCIVGQGWPLPFFYDQFCNDGADACRENVLLWGRLVADLAVVGVVAFVLSLWLLRQPSSIQPLSS